jgi:Asp-tRNA(Asn)/Glu-tRNA(Gln) amidotransferase A subunit family amidase
LEIIEQANESIQAMQEAISFDKSVQNIVSELKEATIEAARIALETSQKAQESATQNFKAI